MKTLKLIFVLNFLIVAQADAGLLSGIDFGGWGGKFVMEGNGHKSEQTSKPDFGLQMYLGFSVSRLFIEYAPSVYLYTGSGQVPAVDAMSYYAAWAGNAGLRLVPGFDLYAGTGIGNLSFRSGTNSRFSGPFLKFGTRLNLTSAGGWNLHLQGSIQRIFINDDEACGIPAGISSRGDVAFLGLGIGLN